MLKKQLTASIAILALTGIAWHADAQSAYPPSPIYVNAGFDHILPYRGTYYDPKQSGTGIQVDLGANGLAFVSYYTYDEAGNTEWYLLSANYQPSDEITRWMTGVIGTMSGPFYQAKNGQCLGCAYKPASDGIVTPYNTSLVWVNSREVIMTVGPQQWDFIAPDFDGHIDGDYLIGNWVIHFIQTYHGSPSNGGKFYGNYNIDNFATITISPDTAGMTVSADASAKGVTPYKVGDKLYKWQCNEIVAKTKIGLDPCTSAMLYTQLDGLSAAPGSTALGPGKFEFWFDQDKNRLGMDVNRNGQVTTLNTHVDLYVEDPNLIIGRGITEGTGIQAGQSYYDILDDGAMNLEVVMQRIPDSSKGWNQQLN